MGAKTGRHAIIEQFLADGIDHMFGNPGTVEQGFLDALADYPAMKYVLTLQETIAVMTADGYARARRKPALVQLHSTPGIGNGVGAVYQAKRGHSPLIIIGGDAGVKYQAMDAQMAGDLVAMMEPVTKWSTMVLDSASLLRTIRRAVKIAATPPMGPVYVCLPMDMLDAPVVEPVRPTSLPSTRVAPDDDTIDRMAMMLAGGSQPMIYVGDGVAFADAGPELERVAELLGAEVWEADAGEVNMRYTHPCYQGMTGHMFGYHSKPILAKGDANLVVGTYLLPEVFPELGDILAPGAKTVHIDSNAYEIAKNHPVDIGVAADPKLTLGKLAAALERAMTDAQRSAAHQRVSDLADRKQAQHAKEIEADQAGRDSVPMHMPRFAEALAQLAPKGTIIFDEALTNSPPISRYMPPEKVGEYFLTRGGSLGVGVPGAIGVKVANPDRPVIGFSGDGGSMYTIQALWTAARHDLDVKFVICNNGSYRLLQLNIDAYWAEREYPKHDYPLSFDLSKPALHFEQIAQGLGIKAVRVEKPADIEAAIKAAFEHKGPFLIDLVLEGSTHPDRIGNTCGQ